MPKRRSDQNVRALPARDHLKMDGGILPPNPLPKPPEGILDQKKTRLLATDH